LPTWNTTAARQRAAALVVSLLAHACSEARAPRAPTRAIRQRTEEPSSWVCRKLVDRFLGLPATAQGADGTPAPLAGCWWVRGCELGLARGPANEKELTLHLDGPGWYWVDFEQRHLQLHQQVPFELSADIAGTIRFAFSQGVASLWFHPTRQAEVHVAASSDLELHGASAWGSILRRVPLLPVREMAAEQLSDSAAAAIAAHIQRGITVTYDLAKGQSDMSFGMLQLGETPRRVFEDDGAWIENTALLLPRGATHVFGPLDPTPTELHVVVEQGPGVAYRALCTRDMPSQLDEVAAGSPHRIPSTLIVHSGQLLGGGSHSAVLRIQRCPYYLIVFSAAEQATSVALRLTAAPS
jgi:hypothetical protein